MLLTPPAATATVPTPDWFAAGDLAAVVAELARRPPLVPYEQARALQDRLAVVAAGGGYALQAGDCAELFAEVSPDLVRRKAAQLGELAAILDRGREPHAVVIGRIAGQYAKPRTSATERAADGSLVPAYLGDAVNGRAATARSRTPRAGRMLVAYDMSAAVLRLLAGTGGAADAAASAGAASAAASAGGGAARYPVFTSHEALLLPYEEPLVRRSGVAYASSAHLIWVGDRTRQAGGPHVALAARVANPVAVKLGPGARPRDVADLIEALDPHRQPGRLTFVVRLGADRVGELLPGLLAAARERGATPVWLCDPMHGNTIRHGGYKVRLVDRVVAEARSFVQVTRMHGVHPGGLHLELTPDDVRECLDSPLARIDPSRYRTACDPRLNPAQARRVVTAFAEEVNPCRLP